MRLRRCWGWWLGLFENTNGDLATYYFSQEYVAKLFKHLQFFCNCVYESYFL